LTEKYDVIVIGAGLAGLTAAAYCARDGQRVLVCEQADQTGGYFRSFTRQGFTFDAGLKAVENAGMLLPMLRQLNLEAKVNLHKCTSAMVLPDRFIALRDNPDIIQLYGALGDHFPAQRHGLKALLRQSDKISDWVNLMVTLPNPYFEDPRRLLPRIGPWFIRNLPALISFQRTHKLLEVPLTDFIRRYISDPALVNVMSELFFGGTPALFGLGYTKVYLDYYYAHNGMQSLTDVLAEYVTGQGGQIKTGTPVSSILVENNKALGIELSDGNQINSSYVISSSDMRNTFLKMIEPGCLTPDFRARVQEACIGESAVCVFLATDIAAEKLPVKGCAHLYYLPDYQGITAAERLNTDFFARTPLEISIPCLNNPALAPNGKSGIIISALAKSAFANDWNTQDGKSTPAYYALKERVADQLVRTASQIVPGLEDHIIFRQIASPYTYNRYTLNAGGSICGWTYDRLSTFHRKGTPGMQKSMLTPVNGLLQAGHWTVYPGGAPVSILSARLAADYIARQSKKAKNC
jgi:phytoene dehydrogenase-like protein